MAAQITQGVYPLNRCKTIHLVRHGQGIHNAAAEAAASPEEKAVIYHSEDYFDAKLTPQGWNQVNERRTLVRETGISDRIELVVVSSLLRTLQTSVGIFGGEGEVGDNPPLMIQDERYSNRPAIPNSDYCPPFVALELCREHLGKCPCDRRRNKTDYVELFPAVDFTLITTEGDELWNATEREPNASVAARGVSFLKWLFTRQEKEIAVVSHDGFLRHTLEQFGNDCDGVVKAQLSEPFANCEIRSYVVVDKFKENVQNDGAGVEE